jgi:hypothetical protein
MDFRPTASSAQPGRFSRFPQPKPDPAASSDPPKTPQLLGSKANDLAGQESLRAQEKKTVSKFPQKPAEQSAARQPAADALARPSIRFYDSDEEGQFDKPKTSSNFQAQSSNSQANSAWPNATRHTDESSLPNEALAAPASLRAGDTAQAPAHQNEDRMAPTWKTDPQPTFRDQRLRNPCKYGKNCRNRLKGQCTFNHYDVTGPSETVQLGDQISLQSLEALGKLLLSIEPGDISSTEFKSLMKFVSSPVRDFDLQTRLLSIIDRHGFLYRTELIVQLRDLVEKRGEFRQNLVDLSESLNQYLKLLIQISQRLPAAGMSIPMQELGLLINLVVRHLSLFDFSITQREKDTGKMINLIQDNHRLLQQIVQVSVAQNTRSNTSLEPQYKVPNNIIREKCDFRTSSLFPEAKDMETPDTSVQKIIVKGSYSSLDSYLNTLFKLMKEDFLEEFREGVGQYKASVQLQTKLPDKQAQKRSKRARIKGVRIWETTINGYQLSKVKCMLRVAVKAPERKRFTWSSKQLMNGSLLLISCDEFATFDLVVVSYKNEKEMDQMTLKTGSANFFVTLANQKTNLMEFYSKYCGRKSVMLEAKVFFEGSYQIMKALQGMNSLPFKENIVFARKFFNPPSYMVKMKEQRFEPQLDDFEDYDWEDMADEDMNPYHARMMPRLIEVEITKETANVIKSIINDPSLTLDPNQKAAIENTFQRELALIQGPPGTGKTYVGAIIVKILMELKAKKFLTGPVFLVCYTNHALDQFLNKIFAYTRNVIRIGGSCQDENIKKFTVQEFKKLRKVSPDETTIKKLHARDALISQINDAFATLHKNCWPLPSSIEAIDIDESISKSYKIHFYQAIADSPIAAEFIDYLPDVIGFLNYDTQVCLFWIGLLDINYLYQKFSKNQTTMAQKKEDMEFEAELNVALNKNDRDFQDFETERFGEDGYGFGPRELPETKKKTISQKMKEDFLIQQNPVYQLILGFLSSCTKSENQSNLFEAEPLFQIDRSELNLSYREIFERMNNGQFPKGYKKVHKDNWKKLKEIQASQEFPMFLREDNQPNYYEEFVSTTQEIERSFDRLWAKLISEVDVIAMTTTGAAKNRYLLDRVSSRVLIVEEAAEVLESHIITSLSKDTEHLILIGDPLQLRPKVNSYRLAKDFNFEISLFERLLGNGMACDQLNIQRRMRPSICDLTRLTYPTLRDADFVRSYAPIENLPNLFFFTHCWPETSDGTESKQNEEEAKFIVCFVDLLLNLGHLGSQITILSLYVGQLLLIKRNIGRNPKLREVRVTTVDNFQGEENDIIVLSLVRSNSKGNIGFLKENNRVNVALSRARKALYMFGDAHCLRKHDEKPKDKTLWTKVLKHLSQNELINDSFTLECKRHNKKTQIRNVEDFDSIIGGGCSEKCGARLNCGHTCVMVCHSYTRTSIDTDGHAEFKCIQPCRKKHGCDHLCEQKCFSCNKKCETIIEVKHPECSHTEKLACKNKNNPCSQKCDRILQCGHQCYRKCSEHCNLLTQKEKDQGFISPCSVRVKIPQNCGHFAKVPCGIANKTLYLSGKICKEPCEKPLICGHLCERRCDECKEYENFYKTEKHGMCLKPCDKLLQCNHKCRGHCCSKAHPPCDEPCAVKCSHSECVQKCGDACVECVEMCDNACEHSRCTTTCFEKCNRTCNMRCTKQMACGHQCLGLCGEQCPNICRTCNPKHEAFGIFFGKEDSPDALFVKLDCGHIFELENCDKYMHDKPTERIEYKKCPRCSSEVRLTRRYLDVIKETRSELNEAKKLVMGKFGPILLKINDMVLFIEKATASVPLLRCESIEKSLHNAKKIRNLVFKEMTLRCLMKFVSFFTKDFSEPMLKKSYYPISFTRYFETHSNIFTRFLTETKETVDFIGRGTDENMFHTISERLMAMEIYFKLEIASTLSMHSTDYSATAKQIFSKKFVISFDEEARCRVALEKFSPVEDLRKVIISSELENLDFYRCPNGHIYSIGDCGAAVEVAVCPECKAQIGGTSHQLVRDNTFAHDVTGRRPRYDVGNYERDAEIARQLQRQFD